MKRMWIFAALALAGCGGGGGGTSVGNGSGGGTGQNFGNLSALGLVSGAPVEASSANTKVIGLIGTFSDVRVREVEPTLDEAVLYWAVYDNRVGTSRIDAVYPNGKSETIMSGLDRIVEMKFNPIGSRIYFRTSDGALQWVFRTGSAPTTVVASGCSAFAISPEGNRIVTAEPTGIGNDLFLRDLSGNLINQLTDSPDIVERSPNWMSASSILYRADGDSFFFTVDTSGVSTRLGYTGSNNSR